MARQEDPPTPDGVLPPVLSDWAAELYDYLCDNRVVDGPGIIWGDAPGGGKRGTVTGVGGVNQAKDGEWSIRVQNFGDQQSANWKFIVYHGSRLFEPKDDYSEVTVNGIASSYDPEDSDPGWHSFAVSTEGIRVWIEIAYDTSDDSWGNVNSADIKWDGGSGSWGGGRFEYTNNGTGDAPDYIQSTARKVIAVIFDRDGKGQPSIDQWITTPLTLAYSGGIALDSSEGSPKTIPLRYPYP